MLILQNGPKPSFESMSFNAFLANDSLKDSNQNSDVNFYSDISSLETSYLSPSKTDQMIKTSRISLKNHFLFIVRTLKV